MMASPSPQSPPIKGGEGRVLFDRVRMAVSFLPLEGGGQEVGGGMMASPFPRSPPIQGGEGRVPLGRVRMPVSLLPLEGGGQEVGVT
jgi:hypothetical protein